MYLSPLNLIIHCWNTVCTGPTALLNYAMSTSGLSGRPLTFHQHAFNYSHYFSFLFQWQIAIKLMQKIKIAV
jgi:hypothetical protein